LVGIGKVQLNFSNTNQIKGSDTMQFLTQTTENTAPLTAIQITMCDNAAAAYNMAFKMLAQGDDKMANDHHERGCALQNNAMRLGGGTQFRAVQGRIMSKRVFYAELTLETIKSYASRYEN
tara:strand:+ start:653 stop:1015 length:363 start_codon:yes stop_codon:yes gene_type:complete